MTGPGDPTGALSVQSRGSHLFGPPSGHAGGNRGALVATASTVVVFLLTVSDLIAEQRR